MLVALVGFMYFGYFMSVFMVMVVFLFMFMVMFMVMVMVMIVSTRPETQQSGADTNCG